MLRYSSDFISIFIPAAQRKGMIITMADKNFFDDLMEDFCTDLDMERAIESSRDANGKIDVKKAINISEGLGHTSLDDVVKMETLLNIKGAFDKDNKTK
jgi:hypothetical protein